MKFINFRDYDFEAGSRHCFQWVDVRKFKLPNHTSSDTEVITRVINSVEYRDDYVGGGIDPDGSRHGPYWLHSLSPDSFDPTSAGDALEVLYTWLRNCGRLPANLEAELETHVIEPITSSESVYILRELDESAFNDYGNLHIEFHELIAIDRPARIATVIVLTDD
ncbi:hypothetical protein [Nocardia sp. NPDC050717]|uniref:hypothetical protein n=1 Tax=Nocardia sp. NPDC050717 TaxID=3157221 RepID=UPI0033C92C35